MNSKSSIHCANTELHTLKTRNNYIHRQGYVLKLYFLVANQTFIYEGIRHVNLYLARPH